MKTPAQFREGSRALQELGLALRSRAFRAALVISVLAHLALLAAFWWRGSGRDAEEAKRIPLMRVRLLPSPPPSPPPAEPRSPATP